ncbi:MAG: tRNA (guanosine(37)-N1)-methyltransferase TrmD [Deltaproteobacteria bacterium]|nr:tRNA (guanosine(37)-N1)-methyltransferase TrmD [Deltaproteobacteria bacterium]
MRFDILTLFPEFFDTPLKQSIIGRAIKGGLISVHTHNIRDFALDKHHTTDDKAYGGGPGMVMTAEPIVRAIEAIKGEGCDGKSGVKDGEDEEESRCNVKVALVTPQGVKFTNKSAIDFAESIDRLIIVCGRYEGFDERIRAYADMEISLGDFIFTGGEIPALAIVDAVSRFIPNVLGDTGSADKDSFSDGLLEYPHYTRPEEFRGVNVPEVLLSGDHAKIDEWRRQESIRRTLERRPELLDTANLSEDDWKFLKKLTGAE